MNPGRYPDINIHDYHSGPGISKSGLDRIARSPKHYQSSLTASREQTDDFLFGSIVHTLVLEPDKFADEYIVAPKCDRRTKAGKDTWAAFEAESNGREVVKEDIYTHARAAADEVLKHPKVGLLLESGTVEESFYWRDAAEGVLCRCRPDFLHANCDYIVDLKTTRDASRLAFGSSAAKFRYHVQAAFYLAGVEAVTGIKPEGFLFVTVEKEPPYAVAVYEADPDFIAVGHELMRRDLRAYAECFFSGEWPGYPEVITPLVLPRWATYESEVA